MNMLLSVSTYAESVRIAALPDSTYYGGEAECSILQRIDRVGSRKNETIPTTWKLLSMWKLLLSRILQIFRHVLYHATKIQLLSKPTPTVYLLSAYL